MKKSATVTIAVCAYNEEKNIVAFLKSVLDQKQQGFTIEKILIISDGSTDNTVQEARKISSPLVEIRVVKKRLGKSTHLNTIYKDLESDILVQSDCDVVLSDPLTVFHLIAPLLKNTTVGMTGGNPMPVEGENFTERAINVSVLPYLNFRKKVRGGDNVFSADGRLLGYRKELVKRIKVPKDMIANDMFTYFCCIAQGYSYVFAKKAVVLFRSPQNLRDHVRQNTRFRAAPLRMERYFPKELVKREIAIPYTIYIAELFSHFIRYPLLSMYIYTINMYCRLKANVTEHKLNAKWDMAISTKRI